MDRDTRGIRTSRTKEPVVEPEEGRLPRWDFFICHAGEDRSSVVEPLARELRARGYEVWYDQWTLRVGDSLRRRIEEGLASSRCGIVVLSRAFFQKEWPQMELDGLVNLEVAGRALVLPVWHEVSQDDVAARSPLLADRVAASTRGGVELLAETLIAAAAGSTGGGETPDDVHVDDGTAREKRSGVLEAISDFRAMIDSLCGGFTPRPEEWDPILQRLGAADAEIRRRLDRNSPWLDAGWMRDVEQLQSLGLIIAQAFRYVYTHDGVPHKEATAGRMSRCGEFLALFERLRGTKAGPHAAG